MLFILGAIAIVAAPVLFLVRAGQKRKLFQMQSVETSTVAQLEETRAQMPGSFVQRVELKGVGECEEPLAAEFTGSPCLAYSISLVRDYEENYWEKDTEGNRVERSRRGSETLASNERRVPFYLRDSTGRIKIIPDGADLVMEKSLSKYELSFPGQRFSMGSFALDLAQAALGGRVGDHFHGRAFAYRGDRDTLVLLGHVGVEELGFLGGVAVGVAGIEIETGLDSRVLVAELEQLHELVFLEHHARDLRLALCAAAETESEYQGYRHHRYDYLSHQSLLEKHLKTSVAHAAAIPFDKSPFPP